MVTRIGMTPAAEAYLGSRDVIYPAIATFVDWPGDPSRSHTGAGPLTVGGQTFSGVGNMGMITTPAEEPGMVPAVAELVLIGVPEELMLKVTNQDARGRMVQVWIVLLNGRGASSVVPGTGLIELFTGFIVKQRLRIERVDEETINFSLIISVGSGPTGRAAAALTHSDEDQRRTYPNDTAGRHVIYADKQAKKEFWVP